MAELSVYLHYELQELEYQLYQQYVLHSFVWLSLRHVFGLSLLSGTYLLYVP